MYDYTHLYRNKGYKYCYEVVNDELFVIRNGEKIHYKAPKYVKLQCEKFMNDLVNFGDGFNINKSCYDGLAEFQWFVLINIFCWKHKSNTKKRRYELIVMLIVRKQAKVLAF